MITVFCSYYLKDDPFNKNHKRNICNTPKRNYNCGGYALETFSWYCPHAEEDDSWMGYDYGFETQEEAWVKTMYAVSKMVLDFEGRVRMIKTLDQLHKGTERVVAFRLSSDGDFHYIKKGLNGWHHKCGASRYIRRMSEHDVFNTKWNGRYDGPVILLAIKK